MADPEMEVDSRKLKVKERQNSRKKRHNTENTGGRGTKGTEGMTIPGIRAGPKTKTPRWWSERTFLQGVSYQSRTWFVTSKMQVKEPDHHGTAARAIQLWPLEARG